MYICCMKNCAREIDVLEKGTRLRTECPLTTDMFFNLNQNVTRDIIIVINYADPLTEMSDKHNVT